MENSEVIVTLMPGIDIALNTDNPNIGNLVDEIVRHRETLDINEICVSCEGADNFDTESFTEVVKNSAKQFLDAIKLEKEAYDAACSSITTIKAI
ncbi:hypothetical protein [Adlercreutzia caecimuris]|uniref:hypothetical protein n=1 Tax=Adlercreutzia caecimuris TaxID=671266 RepID=UPI001C3D355E|nr:hypothetical protein [Adlercreutzia caecimuris]MCR2037995.1 hypothetical protein [Adlercreutzia caecimuris]